MYFLKNLLQTNQNLSQHYYFKIGICLEGDFLYLDTLSQDCEKNLGSVYLKNYAPLVYEMSQRSFPNIHFDFFICHRHDIAIKEQTVLVQNAVRLLKPKHVQGASLELWEIAPNTQEMMLDAHTVLIYDASPDMAKNQVYDFVNQLALYGITFFLNMPQFALALPPKSYPFLLPAETSTNRQRLEDFLLKNRTIDFYTDILSDAPERSFALKGNRQKPLQDFRDYLEQKPQDSFLLCKARPHKKWVQDLEVYVWMGKIVPFIKTQTGFQRISVPLIKWLVKNYLTPEIKNHYFFQRLKLKATAKGGCFLMDTVYICDLTQVQPLQALFSRYTQDASLGEIAIPKTLQQHLVSDDIDVFCYAIFQQKLQQHQLYLKTIQKQKELETLQDSKPIRLTNMNKR